MFLRLPGQGQMLDCFEAHALLLQIVTECLIPLAKQSCSDRLARTGKGDVGIQQPAHRLSFGSAAAQQGSGQLYASHARGQPSASASIKELK